MWLLLVIRMNWQPFTIQEVFEPGALINSVNAAFLVRLVGLDHHDLVEVDRTLRYIFVIVCFLAVVLLIDAFRYLYWVEHI